MKRTKWICACAAMWVGTGIPSGLRAQGDELNRQVEVNKEYRPDVERAAKLNYIPRMTDTVKLRPESEYSIRPSAWHTGFDVDPIAPARVNASVFRPEEPFYLKAGIGFPLNGAFDFAADRTTDIMRIGAYANLYGHSADVQTDYAGTQKDKQLDAALGVYGERRQAGNAYVGADIGYDHRVVTYYGYGLWARNESSLEPVLSPRLPSSMQHFSTPRAHVWLGSDFSDLSRLNVRFDAKGYLLTDRSEYGETGADVSLKAGQLFGGVHRVTAKLGFEGYWGNENLDYLNRIFSVGARYAIELDKVKFRLGADYVYDDLTDDAWFFPDFRITFDVTNGYFVPFVEIDGHLQNNGYRNISRWNPYIIPGWTAPNTAQYNARGGISGSFSSSFSYRAFAGVSVFKKMMIPVVQKPAQILTSPSCDLFSCDTVDPFSGELVYLVSTGVFRTISDNATMFTVGGEIDGRIAGSFSMNLAAQYFTYSMKTLQKAGDRPNFEASLTGRYDYQDKFSASAGVRFIGSRWAYQFLNEVDPFDVSGAWYLNKIDPVVDINVELQYRVARGVRVFLEGHNLGNSKLYEFNHYPSIGVNARAGVILSF